MTCVDRIKAICKERKTPISRLEKDLGFGNGYIGQLRKGIVPGDRLFAIAEYLNVSTEFLLSGEDVKKESAPISENELDLRLIELLTSLTPDEMRQVDAFVQGLLAARKA